MPNFRDKKARAKYAHDDWNPNPLRRKPGNPWPSVTGEVKLEKSGLEYAHKVWRSMGYMGE